MPEPPGRRKKFDTRRFQMRNSEQRVQLQISRGGVPVLHAASTMSTTCSQSVLCADNLVTNHADQSLPGIFRCSSYFQYFRKVSNLAGETAVPDLSCAVVEGGEVGSQRVCVIVGVTCFCPSLLNGSDAVCSCLCAARRKV